MIIDYYQKELIKLKVLAAEFSRKYPAIAPLLNEQSTDPDIQRLMEGLAFLTSQINIKIDHQLSGLVDSVTQLFFPQYLKPIPSSIIMHFIPKLNLGQSLLIPQGSQVASIPINQQQCLFSTSYDLNIVPLRIRNISLKENIRSASIIDIDCAFCGSNLQNLRTKNLRFYINQRWMDASNTFYLLMNYVEKVSLRSPKSQPFELPEDAITSVSMDNRHALYPIFRNENDGHRIIKEFVNQPNKFLFFDINFIDQWQSRGKDRVFRITIELKEVPSWISKINKRTFLLNSIPAVNVFEKDAEPISLNHQRQSYRIHVSNKYKQNYDIYHVRSVTGYRQQLRQKIPYNHVLNFNPNFKTHQKYTLQHKPSVYDNNHVDTFISFMYDFRNMYPIDESISISLLCTNGNLPKLLNLGDIRRPTDTSPENVRYGNITTPTNHITPQINQNSVWKFQSLLALNFTQLMDKNNLATIYNLYLHEKGEYYKVNASRIRGILNIQSLLSRRLYRGTMVSGYKIFILCNPEKYPTIGDMYLFCTALDSFYAMNAPLNTFTQLLVKNSKTNEVWAWKPKFNFQNKI